MLGGEIFMSIKVFTLIAIVVFVGGLVTSGLWLNGSGATTHPLREGIAQSSGASGACC
jgi:hypothetical protein